MIPVGEPRSAPNELTSDFDGDGSVNFADFLVLSNNFGRAPRITPTAR